MKLYSKSMTAMFTLVALGSSSILTGFAPYQPSSQKVTVTTIEAPKYLAEASKSVATAAPKKTAKENADYITKSSGIELWKQMKYGLFMHQVYGGEVEDLTPMSKNGGFAKSMDEFVEAFDVEKWANDLEAMGVEYCIVTAWHCGMNPLYPSEVMTKYRGKDHCPTKRDLLGEMIDALLARGIAPCLYTAIWDGQNFHPRGEGYYNPSNPTGTVTDQQKNTGYYPAATGGDKTKWNDFINECYAEMGQRYGSKIKGFWFDSTWAKEVDLERIMETIKITNPTCAMIGNGDESQLTMFASKETAQPTSKEYGFFKDNKDVKDNDMSTWPVYKRSLAFINGGNWWASTTGKSKYDATTIFKYTVLEACANTGGGGVSWSMSTFADSTWETNVYETMTGAYELMKPIEESIKNTHPSTSFVTHQGRTLSTLKNGIAATKSTDDKYEYIHVLVPPKAGNTITLPLAKDGKVFKSAVMLRTGNKATLVQDATGIKITVPDAWDALDTVIKLEKDEAKSKKPNPAGDPIVVWDFEDEFADMWRIKAEKNSDTSSVVPFNGGYALAFTKDYTKVSQKDGKDELTKEGTPKILEDVTLQVSTKDLPHFNDYKKISFKLYIPVECDASAVTAITVMQNPATQEWWISGKFSGDEWNGTALSEKTADGKYYVINRSVEKKSDEVLTASLLNFTFGLKNSSFTGTIYIDDITLEK